MEVTREKWKTAKALFDAALQQGPDARPLFLARVCPDVDVRILVGKLLLSHAEAGSFLDSPFRGPAELAAPDRTAAFTAGQIIADRFRITRFIAKGGVGEVYEAEDLESQESVAIK